MNIFCELWPFGTYDPDKRQHKSILCNARRIELYATWLSLDERRQHSPYVAHLVLVLNQTRWVAVITPTDRQKSVRISLRNRTFWCRFCVVTLPFVTFILI